MSLECPYCEEEIHDPDECWNQDEVYEYECPYCENNFVFTVSYMIYYESNKADCLNGEAHDWQPVHGSPKEYFDQCRRCSMCSRQIDLNKVKI